MFHQFLEILSEFQNLIFWDEVLKLVFEIL